MAVRITESEYRDFLWANLPPEEVKGLPVEKAWSWVERDCRKTARRVLYDYGGKELRLVKVYVLREVREYPALKVIRGVRVVVRDENDEDLELDLMNVILETNHTYKVIAYNS
jgi:hypothetical protein